jgi:outer membrane receptor protein involved in Fe transport
MISSAPYSASAQRSTEAGLEEIVVTARKRAENLQDVPVAISVFGGDALQQAGVLSARDLYAVTPGLNYDTGFDQNAATPAIRGVVSNEIATYWQKVTTFLDGMPILGQQGTVPFTAIQQVEVLRGPQSAAFGRSSSCEQEPSA